MSGLAETAEKGAGCCRSPRYLRCSRHPAQRGSGLPGGLASPSQLHASLLAAFKWQGAARDVRPSAWLGTKAWLQVRP